MNYIIWKGNNKDAIDTFLFRYDRVRDIDLKLDDKLNSVLKVSFTYIKFVGDGYSIETYLSNMHVGDILEYDEFTDTFEFKLSVLEADTSYMEDVKL